MSLVNCPACGAEMTMDVVFAHDELRRAMHEVMLISLPLATLVLRYLGLFRPAKNRLSPSRMAKLAGQLLPDLQRGAITHRGRDWTMPLDGWRAGLEAMLEKAAADKLTLPLENHNYLYTVLVGLADKVEAVAEAQRETERRSAPRQDTVQVRGQAMSVGDALQVVHGARDPALAKLDADTRRAAPMPAEVRARLAQLRGGTAPKTTHQTKETP